MKIVGICGLGYTGSGAGVDLLKEFENAQVFDDPEFSIAYTPDGLEDLEFHLVNAPSRYMSSDIAISRYIKFVEGRNNPGSGIRKATHDKFYRLSIDYINSIIQLQWKGFWGFDFTTAGFWKRNLIFRILNSHITPIIGRILKRNVNLPPVRNMYLSVCPEQFYENSRRYVSELVKAMGAEEGKTIVLNQPFAADHPTKSFPFFENPSAIIIDRDPRDVYVLIKRVTLEQGRFIPVNDVRNFIIYYKTMRKNQEDTSMRDDVVRLQFEDLIYRYDETIDLIKNVTGLSKHLHPKKYFKPELSINNTQLFLKYREFAEDIKLIEQELGEWLYPFENFRIKPDWKKNSF